MARQPYTLEPRGKKGIYFARFTAPDGRRISRSSGTSDRSLAAEWASRFHAEHYRVARLGDKPRRLWTDAVVAWKADHLHKRSLSKDQHNLRWLSPYLEYKYLDEINGDLLAAVASARRAEPRDKRRRKDGTTFSDALTSQSTVDKMLALIRSILRDASERGWLDNAPSIKLTHPESEDYRWLTREEAAALHEELAYHLRPLFLFSLATGLREQNVMRLEWSKVDIERRVLWVKAAAAKGKKPIGIPLNRDAIAVLVAQKDQHRQWVFPAPVKPGKRQAEPYDRANNHGFKAAQVRAGIAPLRWHDLRHTWASWHVMAGTSLRALMELGGWRSYKSVLRYAHLSPEHLASDAARVEGLAPLLRQKTGT
jgi:integrase